VKGKTIVGHSLQDDLKILKIDLEEGGVEVRDISSIEIFMNKIDRDSKSPVKISEDKKVSSPMKSINSSNGSKKSSGKRKMVANYVIVKRKLKELAEEFLNAKIQCGHHSSIIDARAALALYRMNYEDIEIKYRCQEALQEVTKNYNKIENTFADGQMATAARPFYKDRAFMKEIPSVKPNAHPSSKVMAGDKYNRPMQDIKYLMKNNKNIFNVTPPNKKDEKGKQPSPTDILTDHNVKKMEDRLTHMNLDPFSQTWSFKDDPTSKFEIDKV